MTDNTIDRLLEENLNLSKQIKELEEFSMEALSCIGAFTLAISSAEDSPAASTIFFKIALSTGKQLEEMLPEGIKVKVDAISEGRGEDSISEIEALIDSLVDTDTKLH